MNTQFDQFFGPFWRELDTARRADHADYHVDEDDTHYLLSLDMPGVPKEEIKIEALGNQLVITGQRKAWRRGEAEGPTSQWTYRRAFSLPEDVETDRIEAHAENGVLQIYLAKAEAAKPRQIPVNDGQRSRWYERLIGKTTTTTETPKTSGATNAA